MPNHAISLQTDQDAKHSTTAQQTQSAHTLLQMAAPILQRTLTAGGALTPPAALYLQRAIGNQAVAQLLAGQNTPPAQSGLRVGPAGDRYEQEADQISRQVSAQIGGKPAPRQRPAKAAGVQRESSGAAPVGPEGGTVDNNLARQIESSHSGGAGMSSQMRAKLEPQLGADLSGVRLHTGSDAVQLNQQLGSKAFTHRNHIYYGAGQSPDDIALTSHETVHTIQQGAVKQGSFKDSGQTVQRKALQSKTVQSKTVQPKAIQPVIGARKPIMRAPAQGMIQREFYIGDTQHKKLASVWKQIKAAGHTPAGGWTKAHRSRLDLWVNRSSTYSAAKWYMTGQSQTFHDWKEAAEALDAHVRAQANRKREKAAAKTESKNPVIRRNLGAAMSTIAKWIDKAYPKAVIAPPGYRKPERGFSTVWSYLEQFKGQYRHWYPNGKVQSRLKAPSLNRVSSNFAILREILYALGGVQLADIDFDEVPEFLDMLDLYQKSGAKIDEARQKGKQPTAKDLKNFQKAQTGLRVKAVSSIEPYSDQHGEARFGRGLTGTGQVTDTRIDKDANFDVGGHQFQETRRDDLTPETHHPWVKFAQSRNLPLRAGASNTTDRLLYMAGLAGVGVKGKQAISWAGFIFWNKKYKKIQGSGHTFHEVMDVANVNHAVPYDIDGTNPYQFKEATEPSQDQDEDSESVQESGSGQEKEEVSSPQKIEDSSEESSKDSSDSSSEEEPQIRTQTKRSTDLSLFKEKGVYKTVAEFKVKNSRGMVVTVPPGCDMMITAINGEDDIEIEVILGQGSNAWDRNVRTSTTADILGPALGLS